MPTKTKSGNVSPNEQLAKLLDMLGEANIDCESAIEEAEDARECEVANVCQRYESLVANFGPVLDPELRCDFESEADELGGLIAEGSLFDDSEIAE